MYRNYEGYRSPTEGEAIANIMREEKKESRKMLKAVMQRMELVHSDVFDSITCFAVTEPAHKCDATESARCKGYSFCPFYKSINDQIASLKEANKRLANLPWDTQRKIAHDYYRGKMPWLDGTDNDEEE